MQFKKALLALAVSAALPATAVAQSPAVTDPVTVTAKGFEALVADTPRSVNIITAEEIAFTEARTLGDLLIGQPGLSVYSDGSVGLDPIIRGLKRDQIVVLIDGTRVNAWNPPARGSLAAYINVDLIERIEIIRGPSSVLYGPGGMGGVINIITKGGRYTSEPTVSGFARLGATSVDQGYRTAFGTSFSDSQSVLDISAAYFRTNDYRMGDGERLRDSGTNQAGVNLGYQRKLDERQEIQVRVQRDERRDVWFLASRNFSPNDFGVSGGVKPSDYDSTKDLTSFGLVTHYGPYQYRTLIEGTYRYDFQNARDARLSISAYSQKLERGNYDFSESLGRDYRASDSVFDNYGFNAKLELSPNDNNRLVTGLDWQQLKSTPLSCNAVPTGDNRGKPILDVSPRACGPIAENATLESLGVYLQNETTLDNFIIDVGFRYDNFVGDADSVFGRPGDFRRSDNTFSWSLGTTWKLDAAFNPYLNLSEGYRPAGALERFLSYTYSDGIAADSNPQLAPEKNRTFEIGARGDLGQLSYSVAAYQSDIRDLIVGQLREQGGEKIRELRNIPDARIQGIEYSLNYAVNSDTSVYSWGTWLRGENNSAGFNEPLPQMPPPELSIGVAQRVNSQWDWRAQARFVDSQSRVAPILFDGSERTTSGFATADVFLGYRLGPTMGFNSSQLMLSVTNIFDKDYREHVNDMTVERLEGEGVQDLKRPGRSFGLTWYATF